MMLFDVKQYLVTVYSIRAYMHAYSVGIRYNKIHLFYQYFIFILRKIFTEIILLI